MQSVKCRFSSQLFFQRVKRLSSLQIHLQNFLFYTFGEFLTESLKIIHLSNDPGKVDSNFFCYAATVLSPHRNVLIFTQRMHKPT